MRKALLLQFVSPKLLNCLGKIVMLYKEFLKTLLEDITLATLLVHVKVLFNIFLNFAGISFWAVLVGRFFN